MDQFEHWNSIYLTHWALVTTLLCFSDPQHSDATWFFTSLKLCILSSKFHSVLHGHLCSLSRKDYHIHDPRRRCLYRPPSLIAPRLGSECVKVHNGLKRIYQNSIKSGGRATSLDMTQHSDASVLLQLVHNYFLHQLGGDRLSFAVYRALGHDYNVQALAWLALL